MEALTKTEYKLRQTNKDRNDQTEETRSEQSDQTLRNLKPGKTNQVELLGPTY